MVPLVLIVYKINISAISRRLPAMAAAAPAPRPGLVVPSFASFPLHLFLLLTLVAAPSVVAQASTAPNITLGSTLDDDTSFWASPSGEFAFGFYPIRPNNDTFLLAIWFANIPERTLVWYANRQGDPVVRRGSKAQLRADGQLVLSDHTGQQVWAAAPVGVQVAYAALLDSGNLVLSSGNTTTSDEVAWQSFDYPVDTLLPGQVMNWGGNLTSRRSEDDYSVGRFQLRLLNDGNLVLNTANLPTQFGYAAYWWSHTFQSGRQVVFNRTGEGIHVVNTNGSVKSVMAVTLGSPEDFYQRATLDVDGVLRLYVYPKNGTAPGSRNWSAGTWSAAEYIPKNLCRDVKTDLGSGACGFNSYCRLDKGNPVCACPPGYSPMDPADMSRGCRPDYVNRGCNPDGTYVEANDVVEFFIQPMADTDWPQSDYEKLSPVNEDTCRESCLADCLCTVAVFMDRNCWKKKMPLSNGYVDPTTRAKALIKVARATTNSSSRPPFLLPRPSDPERPRRRAVVQSALLGVSAFVNLVLLLAAGIMMCRSSSKGHNKALLRRLRVQGVSLRGAHLLHLCFFTYGELEKATGKFQEELGEGSFGVVYRGDMELDGQMVPVAVKKLQGMAQRGEEEFATEVKVIGQTHHRNLVGLLGFCNEGPHRLLVYEYMRNGSLAGYLFGGVGERPGWEQRVQIADGVARGLVYLHEECGSQIIHCDIKPQNVLLDGDLTARISDFGLAKLLGKSQTRTNTAIRGTKGYVAPEWFRNVPVTSKVDVYSFGVVLLEIVCCRRNVPVPAADPSGDDPILTDWAYDCYRYGELSALVGEDDEAMADRVRLGRLVTVALWCVQEEPSVRPSMKEVCQMLEGTVDVPVPPDPTSSINPV
uniref:Receptor-like serine/threonine-protein kinase n=1 Tax=Anthurium amnicola TaxID=1678845 RepID=A0A1D1ZKY8_9ARAE